MFAILLLNVTHVWSSKECVCCACYPSELLDYVGSVYGGLSESGLCVFRELRPVSFLIVCESLSVLL